MVRPFKNGRPGGALHRDSGAGSGEARGRALGMVGTPEQEARSKKQTPAGGVQPG